MNYYSGLKNVSGFFSFPIRASTYLNCLIINFLEACYGTGIKSHFKVYSCTLFKSEEGSVKKKQRKLFFIIFSLCP